MLQNRYKRWLRHICGRRNLLLGLRLTTTWRCNSRCKTCHIWEIDRTGQKDLTVEEIDTVTRSKHFREVSYITLSGGEPTLREDLADYIRVLHKNIPQASINMTTNGMNPDIIDNLFTKILKENPTIRFGLVGLSLNGPREIHDATRGVKGSFNRVMETYDRLKSKVPCSFSFTFCKDNVNYFDWVQKTAEEKGTSAYICWTVMNERFKTTDDDLLFWKTGMERVLEEFADKAFQFPRTFRGQLKNLLLLPMGINYKYFYYNVINKKCMPCYAGSQIVHIDPYGNVYPCNFKLTDDRNMGNVREQPFDVIWSNMSRNILSEISRGTCMYPNGLCGDSDIFPSIINNPPVVMRWYLNRLFKKDNLISKD